MMIINTRPEKQSAQLKSLADDEGIEIKKKCKTKN